LNRFLKPFFHYHYNQRRIL